MTLEIGFGTSDITPDLGVDLEGYEHRFHQGRGNSGVLDRLFARALWLHSNKDLILVSLDICLLTVAQATEFRQRLSNGTGVPLAQILLSCSHTHSGPVTANPWGEEHQVTENPENDTWLAGLGGLLSKAVQRAKQDLREGRLSHFTAQLGLGYNRRLSTPGGVTMLFSLAEHPGKVPNGLVDTAVPSLVFEPLDGKGGVLLFSTPYHPVVLGKHSRLVSADYPGAAIHAWEESMPGWKAFFLLGACGDTQPLLATQEDPAAVQVVGKALASALQLALAGKQPLEFDGLAALEEQHGPRVLQVLKIGRCILPAVSAECFTEFGLALRNTPGWHQVLPVTNANGWTGYLPTEQAFAQGGYEIEAALADGTRPEVLSQVLALLQRLMVQVSNAPGNTGSSQCT